MNLTGAVSTVDSKTLASRPVNSVVDALQGAVPGMNFSVGKQGGALNSDKRFNIRGTGTIGEGSSVSPLVLIDGMEGDLNMLNPQDIEMFPS
ncbi:TonB-dependent receptor plug [Bacteroides heparinolyticus]|uniref:TonB-dependent receptor plug n=1 Tax=Prevotella heparinolytica TaxID=28113 RepID=A0A449HZF2_9BACE|nr:TonB-dependent receptor plug [Bacteroides heparinolyticus]